MSYVPSLPVGKCPGCHSICGGPKLKRKGFFRVFVRLECGCGISGSWMPVQYSDLNLWNRASIGWSLISKAPDRPPPPKPLR